MQLPLPVLMAVVLAAPATAGEPALLLVVPDLPGTSARLATGSFGLAWNDSGVVQWREAQTSAAISADWKTLHGKAQAARFELRCSANYGGLPLIAANLAMLAPQAALPQVVSVLKTQRAEAWILATMASEPPWLPASIEPKSPRPDLIAHMAFAPWTHLIAPEAAGMVNRLLIAVHASRLELEARVGPEGFSERSVVPGAKLPLRPLDVAALAGLPKPMALIAAGLDGPALAKLAQEILSGDEAVRTAWEAAADTAIGEMAEGCDGTVALALLPGSASVEWLLILPRRPVFDGMIKARIAAQAPDATDAVFAATAEQSVLVVWPGLGNLAVRCSAARWIVGSSAEAMSAMASDDPAPFALEQICPDAGGASAVFYADLSAALPSIAARLPDGQQGLAQALSAAARHLPATALVLRADEDGLAVSGSNGLGLLLPAMALLPSAGSALAEAYHAAGRSEAQTRMAAILERSKKFAAATSGHWPRDLDDLRSWAKDLPADAVSQAGRADIKVPFCYVQPRIGAPGDQPVLVQDVEINGGAGSLVGFVSGEVRYIPGNLYWNEARRLAALPEARVDGFDAQSWATTPRTF